LRDDAVVLLSSDAQLRQKSDVRAKRKGKESCARAVLDVDGPFDGNYVGTQFITTFDIFFLWCN